MNNNNPYNNNNEPTKWQISIARYRRRETRSPISYLNWKWRNSPMTDMIFSPLSNLKVTSTDPLFSTWRISCMNFSTIRQVVATTSFWVFCVDCVLTRFKNCVQYIIFSLVILAVFTLKGPLCSPLPISTLGFNFILLSYYFPIALYLCICVSCVCLAVFWRNKDWDKWLWLFNFKWYRELLVLRKNM